LNRIVEITADIVSLEVDIVVNAANSSLLGGGGVDGAVHRAAGPGLLEACRKIGGCKTGDAVLTLGFNLRAKHIIHTVGPAYLRGDSECARLLSSCYLRSLQIAAELQAESIAFPEISTGAYGYPKDESRKIAHDVCSAFLSLSPFPKRVILIRF
jgi:O-acetyl-ADP-ribose deacetylase (regulator of RNase III)